MTEWVGQVLSKVQVQRLIGRGGMADVYLGLHTTLNVERAVKILHGHLSDDADLMRRFREEAKAVAALRHPNIVQVYDFDLVDGRPYIVMELLRGLSLSAYLKGLHQSGHSLPMEIIARLLHGIGAALDYAHANGIVHRDVKPANVLLRQGTVPLSPILPLPPDAEPVLTDFGIARISSATAQTLTGTVLGTPAYMSPEQVRGEGVDARSDNYSLGIMLYEMLAGTLPFDPEVDTTASVLYKQANTPPPPAPNVSAPIQSVVDEALKKDKSERYQRAGDLASAFREALASGTATLARRPAKASARRARARPLWIGLAVAGIAVVCLGGLGIAAIGGLLGGQPEPTPPPASSPTPPAAALPPPTGITPTTPAEATPEGAEVDGAVLVQDASLQAVLRDMSIPDPGTSYAAWLVGPDQTVSVAEVSFAAGSLTLAHVDPEGRNLLAVFDELVITVEPDPDPAPDVPGPARYVARLGEAIRPALRRLDELTRGKPVSASLAEGLRSQARAHDSHLGFALSAVEAGNKLDVAWHAEHTINITVGEASPDYGDYDGRNRAENPGDGYGLLSYLTLVADLVGSEIQNPAISDASRADLRASLDRIETAIHLAEDSVDRAKRITFADTLDEAAPLIAEWRTMFLVDPIGPIADRIAADGIRLWIPFQRAP